MFTAETHERRVGMKNAVQVPNESPKWYAAWIADLKRRYRATQIKAAVSVNSALIEFYWNLGKDISEKYPGKVYGGKFFDKLSADLRHELPDVKGFSKVNLTYCLRFFELYGRDGIVQQVVEQLLLVPWGHHVNIMQKCKGNRSCRREALRPLEGDRMSFETGRDRHLPRAASQGRW